MNARRTPGGRKQSRSSDHSDFAHDLGYRAECDGAKAGPLFNMELEKLAQPTVEGAGLTWHGGHALRRGIATNLYSLGASDKIVQRILRHSKATVTREHYIKAVPDDVKNAMLQFDAKISSGTQLEAVGRGKCLILLCGEMAEWLKAAVC